MESAIPEHLRTARTRHRRVPDDYAPPYPSFVARHKPSVERVVMAYFGVQTRGAPSKAAEQAAGMDRVPFRSEWRSDALGPGASMSTKPVSPTS